jgi:vancomycin resistance protein YoaR
VGAFVAAMRQQVRREPVPAVLSLAERVAEPALPGRDLDVDGASAAIDDALARGLDEVVLSLHDVEAPATERLPPGLRLDATLASHTTRYSRAGAYRGRGHNVEVAASRLHAAVIAPGGVLSFNERVGARTRAEGFRKAPVIVGGELVDGLGGGVCQVASTLYVSALYAGFEIVEHRPHSRPSTYVPMGMDATVVWPDVDLKIRNPFEFPVVVFAQAVDGELVVDLVGADDPREVEIERTVVSRTSYGERLIEDPMLPSGVREVTQQGIRGALIARVRLVRHGAEVVAERDEVRYPATDRIVRVGTGPGSSAAVATWSPPPAGPIALRAPAAPATYAVR